MAPHNGLYSDDFVRLLQSLTGQNELWQDFDPSAERPPTESVAATYSTSTIDSTSDMDARDDHGYETTGSADIIFGAHSLKLEDESPKRNYKLSKAHQMASEEPEYGAKDGSEEGPVVWDDLGLKKGEVSAVGETFCPWKLVKGYPGMFVGKVNGARVG